MPFIDGTWVNGPTAHGPGLPMTQTEIYEDSDMISNDYKKDLIDTGSRHQSRAA